MQATTKRLAPLAWIGGGALAVWLAFGHGFANYDTAYSLLWGNEIAQGQSPDYSVALPPTPHPLATLFGVITSPLGDGALTAAVVVAFLSMAAIAYLVYRLGELWLNRWVGLLAAVIVLTRVPVLDFGSRAYVDLPYIAFVLAGLLIETKRPRSGWPVLALFGLAGLLRPEAWLFSGAYLLYVAYTDPNRQPGRLAPLLTLFRPDGMLALTAVAAAAPILWALYDLIVTGDAIYSLTGTRDTVSTLHRSTGLGDAITLGPRRLGEILRPPVLFAAAGGFVLTLIVLRRNVALGLGAAVVALAAFVLLATAGLAVITRYLLLPGTLIAIFAAAGMLGWLSLENENPWRLRWGAFGAIAAVAFLVFVPQQANRLSALRDRIAEQQKIRDDLHRLTGDLRLTGACQDVAISDDQGVPLVSLWLDRTPLQIGAPGAVPHRDVVPPTGYLLVPRGDALAALFALDPSAAHTTSVEITTSGFSALQVGPENRSWEALHSCP